AKQAEAPGCSSSTMREMRCAAARKSRSNMSRRALGKNANPRRDRLVPPLRLDSLPFGEGTIGLRPESKWFDLFRGRSFQAAAPPTDWLSPLPFAVLTQQ